MGLLHRITQAAIQKEANEIEDIIAGLLVNGVRQDEIEIQRHPGKTVIVVRGVPRYELIARFSIKRALGLEE